MDSVVPFQVLTNGVIGFVPSDEDESVTVAEFTVTDASNNGVSTSE